MSVPVAKDENRAIIPRSVFWNDLDSNKIKIPERGSEVAIYAKYAISEVLSTKISIFCIILKLLCQ